jgi:hypothetical protein
VLFRFSSSALRVMTISASMSFIIKLFCLLLLEFEEKSTTLDKEILWPLEDDFVVAERDLLAAIECTLE